MFNEWTWVIVISTFLILVVPLIVVWTLVQLSPEFRLVATIAILVLWGVVSGYKEWIIAKRKEEKRES